MDILIQSTPNPNALKYILPSPQFESPLSFPSVEAAASHPLAAQLFALGGIYNVFMVRDFVTVNKLPEVDWEPLRERVRKTVAAYFSQ